MGYWMALLSDASMVEMLGLNLAYQMDMMKVETKESAMVALKVVHLAQLLGHELAMKRVQWMGKYWDYRSVDLMV